MQLYNQDNFWQMLVYIILLWADHGPSQKKKYQNIGNKRSKIDLSS